MLSMLKQLKCGTNGSYFGISPLEVNGFVIAPAESWLEIFVAVAFEIGF